MTTTDRYYVEVPQLSISAAGTPAGYHNVAFLVDTRAEAERVFGAALRAFDQLNRSRAVRLWSVDE